MKMKSKDELRKENPWNEITEKMRIGNFSRLKNYILNSDIDAINLFNDEKVKGEYRIHENVYPSHFTGNVLDAKIILLTLNPGYKESEEIVYKNVDYNKEVESHLSFINEYMLPVEPNLKKLNPYYFEKLKPIIQAVSKRMAITEEDAFLIVSKNIGKLQFFPYTSKKYKGFGKTKLRQLNISALPSQEFGFNLLRFAIQNGKLIIILRSKSLWIEQVEELENYSNKIELNSYLNPVVSMKNVNGKDNFEKIIRTLVPPLS